MYRFADLGKVWAEVELPYEGDDGQPVVIHLLFRVFTDDELTERERGALVQSARRLQEAAAERLQLKEGGEAAALSTQDMEEMFTAATAVRDSDRAEVLARATDWRGLVGEGDTPIDFDRTKLAALLEHRPIFLAARDALYRVSREGVRKNSLPGPAGSPARVQA